DILEEIVGEFTTDVASSSSPDVHPQDDGSFIIDGTAFVRDVNKTMHWDLPTDGPKSVSGMIVEYLEHIPEAPVCLRMGRYRIEIMQIKDNTIRSAKVTFDPKFRDADD
ncbi:transporter associated domain-containing protein, partial [uncultured Thalassolituus sp.]